MQHNYEKMNQNQEKGVATDFNIYEIGFKLVTLNVYAFRLIGALWERKSL